MISQEDGQLVTIDHERAGSRRRVPPLSVLVTAAVVLLGLCFRFTALDKKYFWCDEIYSAVRISGHAIPEDMNALFDGRPHRIAELHRLQHIRPDQGFGGALQTFTVSDTGHPPLYYALLRVWTECFGDSILQMRCFSALLSLLCFPAVYWLSLELFRSHATARLALALWSVSPVQVLYAQEVRQYGLLAALIIFSSAALLRALGKGTVGSWLAYSAAAALGLNTHVLFAPTMAAHAVFMALSQSRWVGGQRSWKALGSYSAASALVVAAFLPWMLVIFAHRELIRADNRWSETYKPLAQLAASWVNTVSCVFVDFGVPRSTWETSVMIVLQLCTLCVAASAYLLVARKASRDTKLFLFLLTAIPACWLLVPDVTTGGMKSTVPRYWMAALIAVLLTVAHALAVGLSAPGWIRPLLARTVTTLLLLAGTLSCARSSQADIWWNKIGSVIGSRHGADSYVDMQRVRSILGSTSQSVLVAEYDAAHFHQARFMAISNHFDPQAIWLGVRDPGQLKLVPSREMVIYEAPIIMEYLAKNGWTLSIIGRSGSFWRATKAAPPGLSSR